MTFARFNEESDAMDLDRSPNKSLGDSEDTDVFKTCTDPATVRQTIYSPHQCLGIWHGHHMLETQPFRGLGEQLPFDWKLRS